MINETSQINVHFNQGKTEKSSVFMHKMNRLRAQDVLIFGQRGLDTMFLPSINKLLVSFHSTISIFKNETYAVQPKETNVPPHMGPVLKSHTRIYYAYMRSPLVAALSVLAECVSRGQSISARLCL